MSLFQIMSITNALNENGVTRGASKRTN